MESCLRLLIVRTITDPHRPHVHLILPSGFMYPVTLAEQLTQYHVYTAH